jgi:hypothetical protein
VQRATFYLTIYNRKTIALLPTSNTQREQDIQAQHSLIMLMRYLHLAILAATAASALSQSAPESADMDRQLAGDFNWDIQPEDGYPIIGFDNTTEESEVVFKYNFTGALIPNQKVLEVNLYQNDCKAPADTDALKFTKNITGDELNIELDIVQENISNSTHYKDINGTAAIIGFCLRVDYNYVDALNNSESVNFYETNVTINVDLTANFTLAAIDAERTGADNEQADAKLDYKVEAYICLDNNTEVFSPAALFQGSALQVCIKIDDTVVTDNILVEDILTFTISQPESTNSATSTPIANGVANPLTDKVCRESGICNVKTQLQSKFFTDTNPKNLKVDGVAVLAFGKASFMPSSAPSSAPIGNIRRLRVPIRGLLTGDDVKAFLSAQQEQQNSRALAAGQSESAIVSVVADSSVSQRMLQAGGTQSEFGLQVGLQGSNGDSNSGQGDGSDSGSGSGGNAIAAVIVLFLLSAAGLFYFLCAKKKRQQEKLEEVTMHHSGNTFPTHGRPSHPTSASVYSDNQRVDYGEPVTHQQFD